MSLQMIPRKEDDTLLQWLQLRDEGFSTGQIARKFGVTPGRVRTATNRVQRDYDTSLQVAS